MQHPVHELEGIPNPSLGEGARDGGGGIAGPETLLANVRMHAGFAGGGIGISGVDHEHRRVDALGEGFKIKPDDKSTEPDSSQRDLIGRDSDAFLIAQKPSEKSGAVDLSGASLDSRSRFLELDPLADRAR